MKRHTAIPFIVAIAATTLAALPYGPVMLAASAPGVEVDPESITAVGTWAVHTVLGAIAVAALASSAYQTKVTNRTIIELTGKHQNEVANLGGVITEHSRATSDLRAAIVELVTEMRNKPCLLDRLSEYGHRMGRETQLSALRATVNAIEKGEEQDEEPANDPPKFNHPGNAAR